MSAASPLRSPRPTGRPSARSANRPAARTAVRRPRLAAVPVAVARRSRVPFVGLVALILLVGVSGLLLFNTWMQQSAFTQTRMEDRAARLEARQQSLAMSLERTSDPQRLAVRARNLGLVPAVHPAFVRLTDGKVLGDTTPAAAGDAMRINAKPAVKPEALAPAPQVVKVPAPTAAQKAQQSAQAAKKKQRADRNRQSQVQQNVQQNGAGG